MKDKYLPTKISGYVGFFVQAIVNNFLPILFVVLQNVYRLNYAMLGTLMFFNFAAQVVIDAVTPLILAKIGYRKCAVLSQFAAFLGLALLSVLPRIMPPYTAMLICITIYACGSGFTEVILSPMIELLPTRNKAGNMAVLHSFYCWGQACTVLLTSAFVYVLGYNNWSFIPLIWSVIPFVNMFSFLKVPIVEPESEQKTMSFLQLVRSKKFIIFMVMMFCGGASEIAMAEWASIFAQNALGVSKAVGDISGPCAFALFMGLGRIFYAKYSRKISFVRLLIILNAVGFGCYLAVAVCNIAAVSLICCAICGFTVSISWPGIYSLGAATFKNGGAVMFSVLALCGDTGCSIGPWIVGAVADRYSLGTGIGIAGVFSLVIVLCGIYLLKNKDCKISQ